MLDSPPANNNKAFGLPFCLRAIEHCGTASICDIFQCVQEGRVNVFR
jgi:hypothetical protein